MSMPVCVDALARCATLGYRRFNAALGESQALVVQEPADADTLRGWLGDLPDEANSGDVYALPD